MTRHLFLAAAAAVAIAFPNIVAADVLVFDYDFTSSEGFVDAGLATQNGHVAQAAWTVSDSAGAGQVGAAAPGFQRLSADGNLIDWTSLAVGDMVVLDMLNFSASTGANNQLGVLGLTTLTQADGENPGGNGNSQLGGQITSNDGVNYFIDEGAFGVSGGATNTGIALGTAIDYQVKLTKLSPTSADVLQTVQLAGGGGLVSRTDLGVGDAGNPNNVLPGTSNLDNNTAAIFQTQNGNVANVSFGGWSANIVTAAIPEPSSFGLLGMGLTGLLGRRRKR